jgi:hypothetical protein
MIADKSDLEPFAAFNGIRYTRAADNKAAIFDTREFFQCL